MTSSQSMRMLTQVAPESVESLRFCLLITEIQSEAQHPQGLERASRLSLSAVNYSV